MPAALKMRPMMMSSHPAQMIAPLKTSAGLARVLAGGASSIFGNTIGTGVSVPFAALFGSSSSGKQMLGTAIVRSPSSDSTEIRGSEALGVEIVGSEISGTKIVGTEMLVAVSPDPGSQMLGTRMLMIGSPIPALHVEEFASRRVSSLDR